MPENIEKIGKYLVTSKKDGREIYVFESFSVLPAPEVSRLLVDSNMGGDTARITDWK